MEGSHTFERTENSLEHWITHTYIIDSMTMEPETTASITHYKNILNFLPSSLKVLFF
jgi:hypothetical protein